MYVLCMSDSSRTVARYNSKSQSLSNTIRKEGTISSFYPSNYRKYHNPANLSKDRDFSKSPTFQFPKST
jgi:hypothetical protein